MKVVWVVSTLDFDANAVILGVYTNEERAREVRDAAGYQGWIQQAVLHEGPPPK